MTFWLRVSQWYLCVLTRSSYAAWYRARYCALAVMCRRDAQVRQDVQRAQARFIRVFPDGVGAPPAPRGPLAVDVDQLVVVVEDVVRDALDDRAQRRLLGLVGDEVEIERIDEVVSDDLVRARVALPAPLLVRRVVPLAVARLRVDSDLDERARREPRLAGDRFEPDDGLHATPRILARIRLAGDAVAEALRDHVHRRPQPVVVARHHLVRGQIARHAKLRRGGQPPPVVSRLNALDEHA